MDTTVSYRTAVRAQLNIPNYLTAARAVMFVPMVVFMYIGGSWQWGAVVTVLVAGATDGLDGHLARQWGMTTPLGRVGDPLADKFFIDVSLIPIVMVVQDWSLALLWVLVVAYDVRNTWLRRNEIARAFLNLRGDTADLPASWLSKLKTGVLFLLLGYTCLPPEYTEPNLLRAFVFVVMALIAGSWLQKR